MAENLENKSVENEEKLPAADKTETKKKKRSRKKKIVKRIIWLLIILLVVGVALWSRGEPGAHSAFSGHEIMV